jgi:hypothetical protein
VNLSGIIFVVLAIAWAVYLIPKALRHHDEVARDRSVDRFSTAMRVLGHHHEERPSDQTTPLPAQSLAPVASPAAAPVRERRSPAVRRAAARAAAQRRRRILSGLLLVDVVVAVLAALSVLVAWSVAVPVALTGLYLVLCRTQVRREDDASWGTTSYAATEETAEPAVEISPDEDTVALETAELREAVGDPFGYAEMETVAVSAALVNGGSLWDPLPVTLPTYVGKAKAARTVRTIDLNQPNTWSSGRSESDSQLGADAAVAAEEAAAADTQTHRAVGS